MDKIIIYQIFTRLFGNRNNTNNINGSIIENGCGKFKYLDKTYLRDISSLNVTHIWLTGVIRHATTTCYSNYGIPDSCPSIVKGKAGSPYAISDYYDVDPDLADDVTNRIEEFDELVRRIHAIGMKVIIDFVPNHVARQYHSIMKPEGVLDLGEGDDTSKGFSPSNNFYYCVGQEFAPSFDKGSYEEFPARATGNDKFDPCPSADDWYETIKLNYGVDYCDAGGRSEHFDPIPDTWIKMRDILMYWVDHDIDGVRCDMAEMVPHQFWSWVTAQVKEKHPGFLFIGEVYNPSLYRTYIASGFDYLYDKVGMYDCLRDVICGNRSASEITAQWQSTDDINEHMLYFLENHDEQRIASRFFAGDASKAYPAVITSLFMRNNPFMLYFGQEYGEPGMEIEGFSRCDGRTSIFDYWNADTFYKGTVRPKNFPRQVMAIHRFYKQLFSIARNSDAVANGVFFDLMYANIDNESFNEDNVYAFIRKSSSQLLLVVSNFGNEDICVNVIIPAHAFDFLGIAEGQYVAQNLMHGSRVKKFIVDLKKDCAVKWKIKGNNGVVIDLKPGCE